MLQFLLSLEFIRVFAPWLDPGIADPAETPCCRAELARVFILSLLVFFGHAATADFFFGAHTVVRIFKPIKKGQTFSAFTVTESPRMVHQPIRNACCNLFYAVAASRRKL